MNYPQVLLLHDQIGKDLRKDEIPFGLKKFGIQIQKFLKIILQSDDKNFAENLYKGDLRTPVFMLQALSRAYRNMSDTDETYFDRLRTQRFKVVEDSLGKIDYMDSVIRTLLANKKTPPQVLAYYQSERSIAFGIFEAEIKNHWVIPEEDDYDVFEIERLWKKLQEKTWLEPKRETKKLTKVMIYEANDLLERLKSGDILLTRDLENDLHELRRKLRWFPIYSHAFGGKVELIENKSSLKKYESYITPAIINSKYNILPVDSSGEPTIEISKGVFHALSAAIDYLGVLKDKGLGIEAIARGLVKAQNLSPEKALEKALEISGSSQNLEAIKTEAARYAKELLITKGLLSDLIKELEWNLE